MDEENKNELEKRLKKFSVNAPIVNMYPNGEYPWTF
jgi:hypothetical protein